MKKLIYILLICIFNIQASGQLLSLSNNYKTNFGEVGSEINSKLYGINIVSTSSTLYNNFVGSIYSGKAKSSKSGKTWAVIVKVKSYKESSGKVEGEIEWPSLNSVHKIVGQLINSQFTFREVSYIKKGRANLNCQYLTTVSNNKISGTWSDPNSDKGTIKLDKVSGNEKTIIKDNYSGAVFSGKAKSSKSGKSWSTSVKIVSYNQSSGIIEGEIIWPSLNSIHKITGKLIGSQFNFKEVTYIKKGRANLNCIYTTILSANKITGTWTDPSSDKGTIELNKVGGNEIIISKNDYPESIFTGEANSSSNSDPRNQPTDASQPIMRNEIFNNGNKSGVYNGAKIKTYFFIEETTTISSISNYHWNNGRGSRPGKIGLRNTRGSILGTWQSVGSDGMGGVKNANWTVYPNIKLQPGLYQIIDSESSTWSQNQSSFGAGFSIVKAKK